VIKRTTVKYKVFRLAPSGECLRGKSPPDRMLAIPWRRLFLTALG